MGQEVFNTKNENIGQPEGNPSVRYVYIDNELFEKARKNVDQILNYHPDIGKGEHDFRTVYRSSKNTPQRPNLFQTKYAIAYALIEDGRYEEPISLIRDFIPMDYIPEPGNEEAEQLKELKNRLTLLLMQKDKLDPDSPEAKDAEEEVPRVISRDETLRRAREVLPIHVMGALTNALMFENVSDEKKKEKLRSWTTRALLRPYLAELTINTSKGGDIEFRDLVLLIPEKISRMRILQHLT